MKIINKVLIKRDSLLELLNEDRDTWNKIPNTASVYVAVISGDGGFDVVKIGNHNQLIEIEWEHEKDSKN